MPEQLLPTTVVGSYPQPAWLVDEKVFKSQTVPRVRLKEIWRVAEPWLEQAQDDATLIAIRDMERAGIDIITDGEMRRESYSNRFATALEGVDIDKPAMVKARAGAGVETALPRVVGKVRRRNAVEVRDMEFLRRNTDRITKMTLPGPFTMTQQVQNEFYKDQEELAMDYAVAVNEEAKRPREGRRRRDPAGRAVAAQRSGRRAALRHQGDQPRARRHHGADRGAPVLRLCVSREEQGGELFLPRGACRLHARSRSRSSQRSRRSISAC